MAATSANKNKCAVPINGYRKQFKTLNDSYPVKTRPLHLGLPLSASFIACVHDANKHNFMRSTCGHMVRHRDSFGLLAAEFYNVDGSPKLNSGIFHILKVTCAACNTCHRHVHSHQYSHWVLAVAVSVSQELNVLPCSQLVGCNNYLMLRPSS